MDDRAEEWRPIERWPGYEVSNLGRVRSLDRTVNYADGRTRWYPGKLMRLSIGDGAGHLIVRVPRYGRRYVHHLVLEAFVGQRPSGTEGCHGPGGPADNRVVNLRWDTRSANGRDKRRDGTDRNVNKVHCPLGHRLAHPNLTAWSVARGHRQCLACARARATLQHHPGGDFRSTADLRYADIMPAVLAGGGR